MYQQWIGSSGKQKQLEPLKQMGKLLLTHLIGLKNTRKLLKCPSTVNYRILTETDCNRLQLTADVLL